MRLLSICAAIALLPRLASADTSFAAGSIIIPASATYQTDCGAVSLYGLVYNVLRANAWLEANGHGKIEIYYAFKDDKMSPNRCTPTNLHTGPAYTGVPSPKHDDAKWNDGCDFQVFSNAVAPVGRVVNTTATNPATDLTSFATITTADSAHTGASLTATFPNWPSKTIQKTTVASTNVHTVRYWGGSFIVNDLDAITLRALIQGTLVAKDVDNNNISFTPFKSSTCTYGTTVGGQVNLHVARVAFTAPTPKIFSSPPPRLALLARNGNQSPLDGASHPTSPGTQSYTGRVADGILQSYLARAGLTHSGAAGCPAGGYLATNYPSLCPSPNRRGQIYDLFDFRDIVDGRLVHPTYKMLWMPHWEHRNATPTANEATALANIAAFANQQAGVMAECSSVEALEGVQSGFESPTSAAPAGQLQTCSSGSCASTTYGLQKNTGGLLESNPTGALQNCSDPTLSTGADCVFYGYPGDPYSQTADYKWQAAVYSLGSAVADFRPATGSKYRPGVRPLISGVTSLDKTKLGSPTTARAMIVGDFATRSFKDDDFKKSNILYLGDHDQTRAPAGAKLVLQTLLQLGDPPPEATNTEITRASPVMTTVNGEPKILVQGTYESVVPPPATKTALSDAEAAGFEFPYQVGHLRGIRATSISTAGVEFDALPSSAVLFDGAVGLPSATPAGCATSFNGSCRTIFTHTTTGERPTRVLVKTSGSDFTAIKDLVAPGLTTANQTTVISRILAGRPSGSSFVPGLGGIDRSTAAVIGPSLLAGSADRPQMIYVGANDGMLHAFCAEAKPSAGCPAVGRELWAFVPRTLLPRLRKNTARIDGSPRVLDVFGDFDPSDNKTTRTFRTVLLLPTGTGDPTIPSEAPAVVALDVTDPKNPTILWEYATPEARTPTELGQGLWVTTGTAKNGSATRRLAFVHTNNGGTSTSAASVVVALDLESGKEVWKTGLLHNAPRVAASGPVPTAGVPGGVVAVDLKGGGTVTDLFLGTLFGEVWQLDAFTGTNRHGGNPLFRFTDDKKPIGVPPAIFADNPTSPTSLFVAVVSGGYFDPFALSLWSGSQHHVVAMSTKTNTPDTPLTELSGGLLRFKKDLGAGERGFSQPSVVGTQLFVTTDSTDINSAAYGLTPDTGKLYRMDLSNGGNFSSVTIGGGAGSITRSGTELYVASGSSVERVSSDAQSATTSPTNSTHQTKVTRKLWLQGF